MRVIATLLLSSLLGLAAWAEGEGTCSRSAVAARDGGALEVANSCRHMCPVAREATTLGRTIALAMPVASVERAELEA